MSTSIADQKDISLEKKVSTDSTSSPSEGLSDLKPLSKETSLSSVDNSKYSADIKPLQFKMNHVPGTRDRKHISYAAAAPSSSLRSNGSMKGQKYSYLFNSIDQDQFEKYLMEPTYIKILKRRKNLKMFRRLFLAQELKAFDDENKINAFTNQINGLQSPPLTPTSSSSNLNALADRAIWITKFSLDGKFMASAGKSGIIRVWKVLNSPIERWELGSSVDSNNATLVKSKRLRSQMFSSNPSSSMNTPSSSSHTVPTTHSNNTSIASPSSMNSNSKPSIHNTTSSSESTNFRRAQTLEKLDQKISSTNELNLYAPVFNPSCFKIFKEHTADVLDLDWSKNNFLITSSMDRTVKLWHLERQTSLKTFQHQDFVTCVRFHPTDDRFFISGCLDHKVRLWSILENEITFEFDCQDLITSSTLSPGDGKYTIVGTFNGYVHVLLTKGLEQVSSFHVVDKNTQERNTASTKIHHGPRVTGLECFKYEPDNSLRIVVTSSDSRIRIFDLEKKKLLEYLKGFQSGASQHKACLATVKGQQVVLSSSDDHWVHGWKLKSSTSLTESEKNNNIDQTAATTTTTKKSNSHSISRSGSFRSLFSKSSKKDNIDENGKHSHLKLTSLIPHCHNGSTVIKNSDGISFHAHHAPVTTAIVAPSGTAKTLSLSNDFIYELSSEFAMESRDFEMNTNSDTHSVTTSGSSDKSKIRSHSSSATLVPPSISAVDLIGSIIVTTDNTGIIRVFRADISSTIRKKVLCTLQQCKKESIRSNKSGDSLKTLASAPTTVTTGPTGHAKSSFHCPISRAKSSAAVNALALNQGMARAGSISRKTKSSLPFKRASSCTNFNNLNFTIGSGSPRESVTSFDIDGEHVTNNPIKMGVRCDVCHGMRFEAITKNVSGRPDKGYYCMDCGTVLNNFR